MKKLIFLSLLIPFLLPVSTVSAINAVASIKDTIGEVQIQRLKRNIPGRKGLILNDQDVVVTGLRAKATILFRDGSEIRLFQNTRFVIEKSEEMEGNQRGFLNNFLLKTGSFWGKFTKNTQKTKIITPTATCGIKGTSVSLSERNGRLNVSLSTGAIELENEDEKIDLAAGMMVNGITQQGSFKDKVTDLPYRLVVEPDSSKLNLPTAGNESKVDFTLQVVNVKTKQNEYRSGSVFFSVKTDKIIFPDRVILNDRGYARVTATIKPFQKADYGEGRIEVVAVTEGESAMDIGTGEVLLTFDIPKKFQKTIRIDAESGEVN
ncbi:MAG: FecR family protein [Proteobacteria bacterium]|nr:FecR family protein [Pseudomonadota bacterium]